MTSIVTGHDGQPYLHSTTPPEPVFVADQRRATSAAAQAHTGHAVLVADLDPVRPGMERLASVRLPNGRIVPVLACHIAAQTGLATRRILPASAPARRVG